MADDIMTRLRNPQLPCICIDVVLPSCHPCNARLDAADEIERLRAAGDELIAAITAVCYAGPLQYMDKLSAAHKAWKEAKNGSQ